MLIIILQTFFEIYIRKFINPMLNTPGTPNNAIIIAEKKFTEILRPTKLPIKFKMNNIKKEKAKRNQKIDSHSKNTPNFPFHQQKKSNNNSTLQLTITINNYIHPFFIVP